jgi:hypothetical protein
MLLPPLCRFAEVDAVKWSMSALAYAMPTMRISMVGHGKIVRSAGRSGRPDTTNSMRKTRSIGPGIDRGMLVHEAQITGTKNALYKAFLDTPVLQLPQDCLLRNK